MDRAEKRQLLVDHYVDFYALALAMLHNTDDAQDAVQEAVVNTLTRPFVNDVKRYCFQAVRHAAIDIMRHRVRVTTLEHYDPSVDPEQEELYRRIRHAHEALPEAQKTLVELHDIGGYTYDELATLTGMSKMTVRRRIEKAHQTMKENIER
ncbi:MAG: RNA polymerase sigma factor [Bacteroidales bacterium]|nr:RNA polymerase sigma factor [Bacteroidales bacterium]